MSNTQATAAAAAAPAAPAPQAAAPGVPAQAAAPAAPAATPEQPETTEQPGHGMVPKLIVGGADGPVTEAARAAANNEYEHAWGMDPANC